MNPRILKKLSKRADPIVAQITQLERFVTRPGDDIDSSQRVERKYVDRWFGKPNKHGYFLPLKGTVGYGQTTGYYEEEWEEDDAYSVLKRIVESYFTDWSSFDFDSGDYPQLTVRLKWPSDIFKHATDLLTL